MTQEQLDHLIQKYFDGDTTPAQERMLKQELAKSTYRGESYDEVRAVMGYIQVASDSVAGRRAGGAHTPTSRHARGLLRAAAAIALIAIGGGIATMLHHHDSVSEPSASLGWINGHKVESDIVLNSMATASLDYLATGITQVDEAALDILTELNDALDEINQ